MMKKTLLTFIAFVAFGLTIHLSGLRNMKVVIDFETKDKKEVIKLGPATTISKTPASKVDEPSQAVSRTPAQAATKRQIRLQPHFDSSLFEFDYSFTSHVHILRNIYAIPQKEYLPSMGTIISADARHHFVQTMKENSDRPVVYDSSSQRIYPLSYLIRISETTEAMREELQARGFKENLYMPEVGLIYLEANKNNYTDIFDALKDQGYQPEYQLLNRDQIAQ